MDILETVRLWLAQQGIQASIDALQVSAGQYGLFPLGRQELWRREDVLGGIKCRARYSFLLRHMALPGEDAAQNLLRLQRTAGNDPPGLGEHARFLAEQGKYTKQAATGLGIYELRLIAEREETL